MTTLHIGDHIATLNGPSGAGILTAPSYGDDDHGGGHADDWNRIMRDLHRLGWAPLADDWDLPVTVARMSDGGTVYALEASDSHARASDADYDVAILDLLARSAG